MATYGTALATVVAVVVIGAATAGFVAALGLLLVSARRRRVLERAVPVAAELSRRRASVGDGTVREPLADFLDANREDLWSLDALDSLPAELLMWAGSHGPVEVRRQLPAALELLEDDRAARAAPRSSSSSAD